MNVTVVDSIDSSTVATTTVPINSDITSWLNSLTVPTHEGYVFDSWEITAGYITNVTDNATVYIRYTASGGGTETPTVRTFLLNGREIALNIEKLSSISGSANVQVSFSKSLNEISYESYAVLEYDGDEGAKTDATISNEVISFTDADCSSHRFYVFKFYDAEENDNGVSLWNDGLYPTKIKFTFSDSTYKVYNVTKQ